MSGPGRSAEALPPESERDGDGPAFREPWEAETFAMAVALHETGLFTWTEWTDAFSRQLAAPAPQGVHAPEASYYGRWLAALETLAVAKGAAGRDALALRKAAWARAARATPHGKPITLDNDPEARRTSPPPRRSPEPETGREETP